MEGTFLIIYSYHREESVLSIQKLMAKGKLLIHRELIKVGTAGPSFGLFSQSEPAVEIGK